MFELKKASLGKIKADEKGAGATSAPLALLRQRAPAKALLTRTVS
jgi:hypothetical protein